MRSSLVVSAALVSGLAACNGAGPVDHPGGVVDAMAPVSPDAPPPEVDAAPPIDAPPIDAPPPLPIVGVPVLFETGAAGIAGYNVAVDPAGNATVVWQQQADGAPGDVWSRRWIEGVGWDTAVPLETEDGAAETPRLAVDAAGTVTAVWRQSDGTRWRVRASRFVPGVGWGAAQPIDVGSSGQAYVSGVAVDATGVVVTLWTETDGVVSRLWIARFVPGAGWGAPQLVDVGAATRPGWGSLALDVSGNATVTWTHREGDHDDLWANRFVPGEGWGTPALLGNLDGYAVSAGALAVAPDGAVTALWRRHTEVWANRFVPGVGWGAAVQLASDGEGGDVAVDGTGATVAVWTRDEHLPMTNHGAYSIWTSRLVPGAGWTSAAQIGGDNFSAMPRLAVDGAGVVTMWWWSNYSDSLHAKRYVPDVGWSALARHPDHLTGDGMFYPRAAIGASGRMVFAWGSNDGKLWAYVVP